MEDLYFFFNLVKWKYCGLVETNAFTRWCPLGRFLPIYTEHRVPKINYGNQNVIISIKLHFQMGHKNNFHLYTVESTKYNWLPMNKNRK